MNRSVVLLLVGVPASVGASEVVEVQALTERVVMVRFRDGRVEHHKRGQKRSDEKVFVDPLDVVQASRPSSYRLSILGKQAPNAAVVPIRVSRKSKGTDFAWFTDRWEGGVAVNDRPDHAKEHWIYLHLPTPLRAGASYALSTGGLARNGGSFRFAYDVAASRSEAVHVNLLGYVPAAPKFAYVYQWMGDGGSLDVSSVVGKPFRVLDAKTRKTVFTGKVAFRKAADNPETTHASDTPGANFLAAEVAECDFTSFYKPGAYVVAVEGVGGSFPFRIDADVYRQAFQNVARGLYHNRSGIALVKPYTDFERPAPHHPALTPGFKGKLVYSTLRTIDYGNESGSKEQLLPTLQGPLDAWGWYQDAGDWDSYPSHLRVPQELLLAYRLAPRNFVDRELNIPESGNGVPDILDEAAWLPRFCHRLRHELVAKGYGTGGLGLRVDGDAFGSDTGPRDVGIGSWEDVDRTWKVSAEDPLSTYGYAGVAAQLAICLKLAGVKDPAGVDWAREATEAFAWAKANTKPGDEEKIRTNEVYACASLFRLTGEKAYEVQLEAASKDLGPSSELWSEGLYGPAVYALGGAGMPDPDLLRRLRGAVLHTADLSLASTQRRALRWSGSFSMPMLIGQQTTPWAMELAVGYRLTGRKDYLAAVYTTCDYFLGTNALNMTWSTGLGPRHPRHVFHMDAWYNGKDGPHPGVIPYGPWRAQKAQGSGPWDHDWANKTVYPPIERWPGNERWFDNRCSPMNSEFTVHQNTAPAAAIFGFLCRPLE
ncbi:MAG TPA: glycoside hydrolase family 9 protein [Fimbriimonas sp.]